MDRHQIWLPNFKATDWDTTIKTSSVTRSTSKQPDFLFLFRTERQKLSPINQHPPLFCCTWMKKISCFSFPENMMISVSRERKVNPQGDVLMSRGKTRHQPSSSSVFNVRAEISCRHFNGKNAIEDIDTPCSWVGYSKNMRQSRDTIHSCCNDVINIFYD